MANRRIRAGGGPGLPEDTGPVAVPPTPPAGGVATAAASHAVFKKGDPCAKCGGSGKLKYKDPRGIETVCTCQECQPGVK